jgi:hypothetical protein
MSEEYTPGTKARRSRADIDKILDNYHQSGLTQVAFAKEHGLNLGTFRSWVAKRRTNPEPGLCPVSIRQDQRKRSQSDCQAASKSPSTVEPILNG